MPTEESCRSEHSQDPATDMRVHKTSSWFDLFDQAPVGYCTISGGGIIQEANLTASRLLEVDRDELVLQPVSQFVVPEHHSLFSEHISELNRMRQPLCCELRMRKGSGETFWASVTGTRPDSSAGEDVILIVLSDVTHRKNQEAALFESNERYRHAIDATREGIWDWNIASGHVYFSPQWARLLGYEPDEVPQRVEFFFTVLHPDDTPRVTKVLNDHLNGLTPVKQDEVRLRIRSGEYRWFFDRGQVVSRDASGTPLRMVGTISDITERKRAEAALKESQARTRLLIKAASLGLWDWDLISNDVYFSPEWKQQLGYSDEELPSRFSEWANRLHPDDLNSTLAAVRDFREGRRPAYDVEFRMRHRDGSWRWIFARADVLRDGQGLPVRMMGCHFDITDRKEAEQTSNRWLSLMRATLESTADGILVVNADGKFEIFNRVFQEMWRIPDELLVAGIDSAVLSYVCTQFRNPEQFLGKVQFLYTHPTVESFDTLELNDGRVIERYSRPQLIDGRVVGRVWSFRDVTERKQAEAAQAEALGRLQKIASRIPGMVYQFRLRTDGTACIPYASDGMREILRINPEAVRENLTLSPDIIDRGSFIASILKSAHEQTPWVHEFQIRHSDGSVRWLAGNSLPEKEADGSTLWHGVVTDITARRQAESKLRDSERRLREAQAISQIGNFHWDAHNNQLVWSDELFRIYGQEPASFEPTFEWYISAAHPEDRSGLLNSLQMSMTELSRFDLRYRILLQDGSQRWIHARGIATVARDGCLSGLEVTCQDITEQKRAEATRASLEAQLRESQKMEAIGTLAGGIAHDFNNILATILSNVENALHEEIPNQVVRNCLVDISTAGTRAKNLVQQILSFSRKQPTDRKQIRLHTVVEESARLLKATLPSSLELQVHCDPCVPAVMADATQIEQVLLNLASNSMQAMRGRRGTIGLHLSTILLDSRITSSHKSLRAIYQQNSGTVVRLSVKDDGPGMDATTIQRVFEPFFTTKPVGEGTGLGLAVVHGIVQRHGGVITVESKPGNGAEFAVYLPVSEPSEQITEIQPSQSAALEAASASDTPHILYLDDDKSVLLPVKHLLERQGYRVTCFVSQQEAIEALSANPASFDVFVTDYNMPGMHGIEVARAVRSIRPDLPVAITSGYIDEELQQGAERFGVRQLIAKPFALNELYAAIHSLTGQAQIRPE